MKALVVYDSAYGNTEQIALAIGGSLGTAQEVGTYRVGYVEIALLAGVELLIVGSPTQRFSPTPAISSFLKSIPHRGLQDVRVAAFDTRLTMEEMKSMSSMLSFSANLVGETAYAARHIAGGLKKKNGRLVVPPQGFYVNGTEGPLLQGELERAMDWARQISAMPG